MHERNFRYERKYYVDKYIAQILKQRLSCVMPLDEHSNGQYLISSLYFDDCYNTSFFQKINSVTCRNKLRVRYYNGDENKLKLECKYKQEQMIYKEGIWISNQQYQMMRRGEYSFMLEQPESLWRMFYSRHVTTQLRPVVMVEYNRLAYTYKLGNIRITFDSDLRAGTASSPYLFPVLPEHSIILELKYYFLPSVISDLFSGISLSQMPISKYTMARQLCHGFIFR